MTHDKSINFDFMNFCAEVKMLAIICYQIPVKAHLSIGKVEKYHTLVCCVYDIIQVETRGIISKNAMLQMTFKAVNDTAEPNGLVLTLFVFGAYLYIVMDLPSLSSK